MLRQALHCAVVGLILTGISGFSCYAAPAADAASDNGGPQNAKASAPASEAPKASHATPASAATAPASAASQPQPSAGNATQPTSAGSEMANPPAIADNGEKVSTEALEPRKAVWPFSGMGGYLDKQAAQRGFQIYSQVCSACHSMNLVAYRNLSDLGFSEAEIKAIASQKQVDDMDDSGQHVQRPGKPFDHFVPPFANEKASRAANNGAYPPDLSLIIKARERGPDYVYSILTGFSTPPANEPSVANKYYNPYFEGHWISMPPPLHDNAVTYQDGTPSDIDHMARDVVTFLQWASEPEMQARHETGMKVLIFLIIMAVLFYIAKKRVWKNLKD